jgi:hypothetical protein
MKDLGCEAGISLVEVTIAGAVGIGIVVGITQAMNSSAKMAKELQNQAEFSETVGLIRSAIVNEERCLEMLEGQDLTQGKGKGKLKEKHVVTELKFKGNVVAKKGDRRGGLEFGEMEIVPSTTEPVKVTLGESELDRYEVVLRVNMSKTGPHAVGARALTRDIPFSVLTDPATGRIISCQVSGAISKLEIAADTLEAFKPTVCELFDKAYDGKKNRCVEKPVVTLTPSKDIAWDRPVAVDGRFDRYLLRDRLELIGAIKPTIIDKRCWVDGCPDVSPMTQISNPNPISIRQTPAITQPLLNPARNPAFEGMLQGPGRVPMGLSGGGLAR